MSVPIPAQRPVGPRAAAGAPVPLDRRRRSPARRRGRRARLGELPLPRLLRRPVGHRLVVGVGRWAIREDLRHWVNDGLMTLFFLLAGLEIKRELTSGELRDRRRAALPVLGRARRHGGAGTALPRRERGPRRGARVGDGDADRHGARPRRAGAGLPARADRPEGLRGLARDRRRRWHDRRRPDRVLATTPRRGGRSSPSPWSARSWCCAGSTFAGPPCTWCSGCACGSRCALPVSTRPSPASRWACWRRPSRSSSRPAGSTAPPLARAEHLLLPWVTFAVLPLFALANGGVELSAAPLSDPAGFRVAAGLTSLG